MAGGLKRAHLVAVQVAGVGADGRLPRLEQEGAGHHVGLGAADEELHHGVGAAAHLPDALLGPGGVPVVAVAVVALQVDGAHRLQNLGVGAEGVVVAEEILFHHAYLQLFCEKAGGRRLGDLRSPAAVLWLKI